MVQATGLGKTVVLAALVSEMIREEKRRPVILCHREELVAQTVDKLRRTDRFLSVGVIQAERHEVNADIVVASIQSISRRLGVGSRAIAADRFDLVIADECHHYVSRTGLATIEYFGALDPGRDTLALGVTATLARSDGIPLGHLWEEVCFEYSAHDAITDGYLVRPLAQRVVLDGLDLKGVKIKAGDFSEADLGKRMYRSGQQIAVAVLEHAPNRRGITFAPTVECANQWAADFNAAGIRTEVVIGTTPTSVRQENYRKLTEHQIDMIASVLVLTEGFDLPAVDLIVMGRPTRSMPLYQQCIGRGLRLSPETGKVDCLILDLCGTIQDKITTLVDLDIPDVCECTCPCEFEHLCVLRCTCPRTRSGKLKRPCVVCRKNGTTDCFHYDRRHVVGCVHGCDGIGKPGVWDEDPVDEAILDAAGNPIEWEVDHSEVRFKRVDLFEGGTTARRRRPRSGWFLTDSGIPCLATTSTFSDLIFLWADGDSWTVGVKPPKGRAEKVKTGLTFADAIHEAQVLHPRGGRPNSPLVGPVTEGQVRMLNRFNVPVHGGMTKDQASTKINQCLASQALDPR